MRNEGGSEGSRRVNIGREMAEIALIFSRL
jgi:hypothetical protein